jgi:hypothetical protein
MALPVYRRGDFSTAPPTLDLGNIVAGAFKNAYGIARQLTTDRQRDESQRLNADNQAEDRQWEREDRQREVDVLQPLKEQLLRAQLGSQSLTLATAQNKLRKEADAIDAERIKIAADDNRDNQAAAIHSETLQTLLATDAVGDDVADAWDGLRQVRDSLPEESPRRSMITSTLDELAKRPNVSASLTGRDLKRAADLMLEPLDVPPDVSAEIDRALPVITKFSDPEVAMKRASDRRAAADRWRESQIKNIGSSQPSARAPVKALSPSALATIAGSDNVSKETRAAAEQQLQSLLLPPVPIAGPGGSAAAEAAGATLPEEKKKAGASFFK